MRIGWISKNQDCRNSRRRSNSYPLRPLLLRTELQPILRNLMVLDWVLREDIAQRFSLRGHGSVKRKLSTVFGTDGRVQAA
jgi:hypothetical protein